MNKINMVTPAMFVPAPGFRISEMAEAEWVSGKGLGGLALKDVVAAAFSGTALVAAGPTLLRKDKWKVVLDVLGSRVDLKVRCDVDGRWKVVLSAWGVHV